ncbi:hypothetical protein [Geobacillus subterraneus]|uniref:Chromosome segregation ATPase n=1 Tax=Geobacillus subterraneus TaxID=129338 RepID=A0A679FZ09_9BACL|nr:hypothetical protein [Geobacillus subterraneus]BBW98946.1 chromosome segregation ATPase [Geobacillus subterraneus]
MEETKQALEQLRLLYYQESGKLKELERAKKEKERALLLEKKRLEEVLFQQEVLRKAADEARMRAKRALEEMGTKALQYIIGDHVSLEVELSEKGGQPIASFWVRSRYGNYVVETDPAEEEGGGIADVVSFSLFVTMLELMNKENVAPLFLDEPSKYVSKGHSEQVARFLYEASHHFKRQVFMITHDEHLAQMGDCSYHVSMKEGRSVVQKVK